MAGLEGRGKCLMWLLYVRLQAMAKRSWYRNILMHGFHRLVVIVAGPRCPNDTQCGFKVMAQSRQGLRCP